jgi:hypothetical protein
MMQAIIERSGIKSPASGNPAGFGNLMTAIIVAGSFRSRTRSADETHRRALHSTTSTRDCSPGWKWFAFCD